MGQLAQFFLLPAFTYLLTPLIKPAPSIAMGMILVAACPGGNVSNFVTYLSRGNVALSVSMTAASSAAATFMTPFNIAFWGSLNPDTNQLISDTINVSSLDLLSNVFFLLGLPLIIGLVVSHRFPVFAQKIQRPFKIASITVFSGFIIVAFLANLDIFLNYIHIIFIVVLIHNIVALSTGYFSARAVRLKKYDAKAVAVEVGIQNSGLGLALIFNSFDGLGGMALVASWWGIWHIIAGLSVSAIFSRFVNDKNH